MDIRVVECIKCMCPSCMEVHEVKEVLVREESSFKATNVQYEASYFLCEKTEELYENEQQIKQNDIHLKDAYRRKMGLLTSKEIVAIRNQYSIGQRDLSIVLGWGQKTITRYEGHQVQNRAHNDVLQKISEDPEWFIKLLENSKDKIPNEAFEKYLMSAMNLCEEKGEYYITKAIKALSMKKSSGTDGLFYNSTNINNKVNLVKAFIESVALAEST